MFIEIILFLFAGVLVGLVMGLIPGIHPNTIILAIPFLMVLGIAPLLMLVFIVSMAIVNVVVDFVPSILFGAPDSESGIAAMPGHRLLMQGYGYDAIKFAVSGCVGSVLICIALLPLLIVGIPGLYEIMRPFMHLVLIGFALVMVVTEKDNRHRMLGFLCFMLAGIVGLLSFQLPLDKTLVLFPVFSGLFGLPVLVLQTKNKTELPIQTFGERKAVGFGWLRKTKAIIVGTVGGMFSGFLPGVGTSEIGSMATVDRNDRSFLIVMGAIVTSNVLLSFICLGLIGKGRSGVAVAAAQFISIGPAEILLICVVSLVCVAIGVLLTLFLSKRIISFMRRINYTLLSKIIIAVLVVLVFLFTGLIGLFVCALCCCLGLFANLVNVKRGLLMGVLMLPTILFFAGF